MTVGELLETLKDLDPSLRVVIKAKTHKGVTFGPSQSVGVDALWIGFDWNSGTVTLSPSKELRTITYLDERDI